MRTIVVDTSAIMAVLLKEPDGDRYSEALLDADVILISAPTVLEATLVSTRLTGSARSVERFLASFPFAVRAFDAQQLAIAQAGFAQFGKGRHPAKLNLGDCFAYALSKSTGFPLLWKGDDFTQTDLTSALDTRSTAER